MKGFRRVTALLLSLAITFTFMPSVAFAAGDPVPQDEQAVESVEESGENAVSDESSQDTETLTDGAEENTESVQDAEEPSTDGTEDAAAETDEVNPDVPDEDENVQADAEAASDDTESTEAVSDENTEGTEEASGVNDLQENEEVLSENTEESEGEEPQETEGEDPQDTEGTTVESISYTRSEEIVFYENFNGQWDSDGESDYYRYTGYGLPVAGDELTINGEETYTYRYGSDGDPDGFYDENGVYNEELSDNFYVNSNQEDNHWYPGENNGITVSYMDCEYKVPVTIKPLQVESISFTPHDPYEFRENTNGEMDTREVKDPDTGEVTEEEYFRYNLPDIMEDGNVLTINGIDFTCQNQDSEPYFADSDGVVLFSFTAFESEDIVLSSNQSDAPWTADNDDCHFTIDFGNNVSVDVPVTIVDNPVKSIEINPQPIKLFKNIDGYMNDSERYDEETDSYIPDSYFVYETRAAIEQRATITINGDEVYTYDKEGVYDEETEEWTYGFRNKDGEYLDIEYYGDDQSENHWDVGEHTCTISVEGVRTEVTFEVINTDVKSVRLELAADITRVEGCNGSLVSTDDGEYFKYNAPEDWEMFREGNKLFIDYGEGETEYTCIPGDGEYYYGDENGNKIYSDNKEWPNGPTFKFTSDQDENHWDVGEHVFKANFRGYEFDVPVTVVSNPVKSISFSPESFTICENTDGGEASVWDNEAEEYVKKFIYYPERVIFVEGNKLLINGTEYAYGRFSSEYGENVPGFRSEDGDIILQEDVDVRSKTDQETEPWALGGTYAVEISYKGRTCDVNVTVVDNPVKNITFIPAKPYTFIEGVDGGPAENEGEYIYSRPDIFQEGNILKFNDGEYEYVCRNDEENGPAFYDKDNNPVIYSYDNKIEFWDSQNTGELWKPGEHAFYGKYMGCTFEIPVTIEENPVKSISFERGADIVIMENSGGYISTNTVYDEESGEYVEKKYFYYTDVQAAIEGSTLTVTTDEGDITYIYHEADYDTYMEGGFCDQDGKLALQEGDGKNNYRISYNQPWYPETENTITLEYMGKKVTIPVTVEECQVESISFEPEVITLTDGKDVNYDYDGNKFFIFDDKIFNFDTVIKVTYKDGTEAEFKYDYRSDKSIYEFADGNGNSGRLYYSAEDNNTYNWEPGNSYPIHMTFLGFNFDITAEIKANPIESITMEPNEFEVTECFDGDYNTDSHDEEYFRYYYLDKPYTEGTTLTVKYSDKTEPVVYTYTYDRAEGTHCFKNESGEILRISDSRDDQYNDHWEAGNAYDVNFIVEGTKVDAKIKVNPNPYVAMSFTPSSENILYMGADGSGGDYYPVYNEGDIITLAEDDGTEDIYTYGYVEDEYGFYFSNDDGEILYPRVIQNDRENGWSEPGMYSFTLISYGQRCTMDVKLLENPVKSFTYIFKTTPEYIEGVSNNFDNEDGELTYYYSLPVAEPGDQVEIEYKDGTSKTLTYWDDPEDEEHFTNGYFDSEGNFERRDIEFRSSQEDEPWTKDGDNFIYVNYMGLTYEYEVNLKDNPVESIEYKPVSELNGYVMEGDDDDLIEGAGFLKGDVITVHYKDGSSKVLTYTSSEDNPDNSVLLFRDSEGNELMRPNNNKATSFSVPEMYMPEYDASYEGTYNATIRYFGRETTCPINVKKAKAIKASLDIGHEVLFDPNDYFYFEEEDGQVIYYDIFGGIEDYTSWKVLNLFESGDKIAVDFDDGSTEVFTFDKTKFGFFNESGNVLMPDAGLDFDTNQYSHIWEEGNDDNRLLYVTVLGVDADEPIHVNLEHKHVEEIVPGYGATCTQDGLTDGIECSVCGETLKEQEVIPAKGHDWGTHMEPATTDENGILMEQCKVCGETRNEQTIYKPKTYTLSATSYTYNGKAKTPAITITDANNKVIDPSNYKVTYKNNVNAGTATATVTFSGNYYGTKAETFKIAKANQTITAKSSAAAVSVGKTATVSITGAKGKVTYASSDKTIATVDAKGKVTPKKVGTVKITVTSAATSNYNKAAKAVTIKVTPGATTSVTASNLATGMKITWKKVTGATGYKVYRGTTLLKTITKGTTLTYTDAKANTNGTKYTFRVVAYAKTGTSSLSKSVTTYRVARPAISSLKNSASKKMTVKWGKNSKATGYEIQYSLSKTFAKGNKSVKVTKAATVSKTIVSLTKGKTYYVRVRTYKTVSGKTYYSTWSATKSVKIAK